jgi:GTP1/Obg family GTP-binding protein
MDVLLKEVSARFSKCVNGFPRFDDLHPFEQSLVDLSVGVQSYSRVISNVEKLRKEAVKVSPCESLKQTAWSPFMHTMPQSALALIWYCQRRTFADDRDHFPDCRQSQVGKDYATRASRASTAKEAEVLEEEGVEAMRALLVQNGKGAICEMQQLSKKMRQVPQIDLYVPTVRYTCILLNSST